MLSVLLLVLGVVGPAWAPAPAPQAQPPSEPLRLRVEQLHEEGGRSVRGVRLLEPDAVSHFFQIRNFTPAWQGAGPDQILKAIRDVEQDGLVPRDYHLAAIESLRAAPADTPGRDADLQILLTDAVAALVNHVRFGRVRPVTLDRRWNVDPRAGAPPLEAFLADVAAAPSAAAAIEALKSPHFIYRGLKQALAAHRAMAPGGPWTVVPAGAALKPGARNARVIAVRKRLAATGELATASGSEDFDEELAAAVKRFQERHRLTADGSIGKATLDAMNVTAAARVDQIRVNLERARWVLGGLSDTFLLGEPAGVQGVSHSRREERVGDARPGRQSGTADADLPRGHAVHRVQPGLDGAAHHPGAGRARRHAQGGERHREEEAHDRRSSGAPRVPRQHRLDDRHAADVSLHAAPAARARTTRSGASSSSSRTSMPSSCTTRRARSSSGPTSARSAPVASGWRIRSRWPRCSSKVRTTGTSASIQQVVDDGKTETVFLKQPLPVLIVYWTVSVGASGELRYARDVYSLDPVVLRALNASNRP